MSVKMSLKQAEHIENKGICSLTSLSLSIARFPHQKGKIAKCPKRHRVEGLIPPIFQFATIRVIRGLTLAKMVSSTAQVLE
jgi:hypothetical protein